MCNYADFAVEFGQWVVMLAGVLRSCPGSTTVLYNENVTIGLHMLWLTQGDTLMILVRAVYLSFSTDLHASDLDVDDKGSVPGYGQRFDLVLHLDEAGIKISSKPLARISGIFLCTQI